uniref:Uncharacterized protein n=1 Tax=Pseudonaja textilis TaxID=8673 RepID=A0A670YX28_PSETE
MLHCIFLSFVLSLFILKPATFPYCFIFSINLGAVSNGSSNINTRLSAKACNLYSSFLIFIPFISLSSLIFLFNTSNVNSNSRGDSGQPCLVPFLISMDSVNSPFIITFAVCSWYIVSMAWIKFLQKPICINCSKINHQLTLSKAFCASRNIKAICSSGCAS